MRLHLGGRRSDANLPPPGAPEIAFAGRSNVGKSSLLNALTNRKTLARTSNTPGRTRELNFFALGGDASAARCGSSICRAMAMRRRQRRRSRPGPA